MALHFSVGLELRKGFVSLRPELRGGIWSGYRHDDENQVVFSSSTMEFVVGFRIHPFAVRP
jgi:hypothetical protein